MLGPLVFSRSRQIGLWPVTIAMPDSGSRDPDAVERGRSRSDGGSGALQQEIQRRQKRLPQLIAQRDALNREIAALQGVAEPAVSKPAQPAPARKPARRQAKNKISLADALAQFAKGKAKVTVGEAMRHDQFADRRRQSGQDHP